MREVKVAIGESFLLRSLINGDPSRPPRTYKARGCNQNSCYAHSYMLGRCQPPKTVSRCCATASATSSRQGRATTCTPMGKPSGDVPPRTSYSGPTRQIVGHGVTTGNELLFGNCRAMRPRWCCAHRANDHIVLLEEREERTAEHVPAYQKAAEFSSCHCIRT